MSRFVGGVRQSIDEFLQINKCCYIVTDQLIKKRKLKKHNFTNEVFFTVNPPLNIQTMKNCLIALACLTSLSLYGQIPNAEFDAKKWEAPYTLPIPKGWNVERFLLPASFAPEIKYTGVEDIRFTPGWGNVKSDEYWTYAFLWYLDGNIRPATKIINQHLNAYYTGLIKSNIEQRKIPAEKLFTVKTSIKKVTADKGDLLTFRGTIYMLDYMQQKPITLNCIVHLKSCQGQNKTFLFTEISPKAFTNNVWKSLNQLWTDFSCDKEIKTN